MQRAASGGSVRDKLFYAQVREDPLLEIEALRPASSQRVLAVSSGGCTSLSLLAAGAGDVVSIDRNRTQNDLVELKTVALARLEPAAAAAFLGAWASRDRLATYDRLKVDLSPGARGYWDERRPAVRDGVLGCGVTEKAVHALAVLVRLAVHPRARAERMLACTSLDDQRRYYREVFDNARWRALFPVLLNRFVFQKAYDPAFFEHVDNPSFARHFHKLMEHTLTELPVRDNYLLRFMLLDEYPRQASGLPPYLAPAGARIVRERLSQLALIDGDIVTYLEGCEAASFDGIAASNVGEWMSEPEVERLLRALARALKPRARVCIRNFVGWTKLPAWWQDACPEVTELTDRIRADRSGVQRRFVVSERAS